MFPLPLGKIGKPNGQSRTPVPTIRGSPFPLGKYSPSPLGKGDRRRRRWWMRCSCFHFCSAKFKLSNNPSTASGPPPSARGRRREFPLSDRHIINAKCKIAPLFRSANIHLPLWGRGTAAFAVVDEVSPLPLPLSAPSLAFSCGRRCRVEHEADEESPLPHSDRHKLCL